MNSFFMFATSLNKTAQIVAFTDTAKLKPNKTWKIFAYGFPVCLYDY